MSLIHHLMRACAPAIAMAALFAAAPASAADISASADLRSCAKPKYPAAAIKAKREGTVTLAFLVGADSKLVESKVETSSGHADLDEATHAALSKCKFKAASQDGKPVQEWTNVKYVWTLK
jgi:TonB family protein